MNVILIVSAVYLLIGTMIVEVMRYSSLEYDQLVRGNYIQYLKDVIMWFPDLLSFMNEDKE